MIKRVASITGSLLMARDHPFQAFENLIARAEVGRT